LLFIFSVFQMIPQPNSSHSTPTAATVSPGVEWKPANKAALDGLPSKNSEPWTRGTIGQSFNWGRVLPQATARDPYAGNGFEMDDWIAAHMRHKDLGALFGKGHGVATVRAVQRRIYVIELPDCFLIHYAGQRWKIREKDAVKAKAYDDGMAQIKAAQSAGGTKRAELPPEIQVMSMNFIPIAHSKRAKDLVEWAFLFAERVAERAKDTKAALVELDTACPGWMWGSKIRAKKESQALRAAMDEAESESLPGGTAEVAGDPIRIQKIRATGRL